MVQKMREFCRTIVFIIYFSLPDDTKVAKLKSISLLVFFFFFFSFALCLTPGARHPVLGPFHTVCSAFVPTLDMKEVVYIKLMRIELSNFPCSNFLRDFYLCQDRLSCDTSELGMALLCSSRAGSVYVAVSRNFGKY